MLREIFSNDDQFKDNIENIFKTNCSEGNCKLKGDLGDYAVLDGDVIKDCLGIDNVKSVDCILLKVNSERKKVNSKKNIDVLLCELCSGSSGKSVTDVKMKMQNSGKDIFKLFTKKDFNINQVKCLYLGKYKIPTKKPELIRVNIEGSSFHNIMIQKKSCGFTLNDSFFQ